MPKKRRPVDPDNPEWTKKMFAFARPASEVMADLIASPPRMGRPKLEKPKQQISLRLDPDVLAAYRGSGSGWQKRMQDVLARGKPMKRAAATRKVKKRA